MLGWETKRADLPMNSEMTKNQRKMKSLSGSIDYQINKIFMESKIFCPGESKHKDKNRARDLLSEQQQPAISQNISKHTRIHAYSTAEDYKDTWHSFARFAKREFDLKDITLTSIDHIQAYFEDRIASKISISTWIKEAAHLSKFQNALELFVSKYQMDRAVGDFRLAINQLRPIARNCLSERYKRGGYIDPLGVISHIPNQRSRLVARIQFEGGARLREAVLIKQSQMLGFDMDPVTKKQKGKVHLSDTKGGKPRDIYLAPDTFRSLQEEINKELSRFSIKQKTYAAHIAEAAKMTGESNCGTHDFRYSFAQNRYLELTDAKVGLCHEQAIQQISWEMGHERASITMHYL